LYNTTRIGSVVKIRDKDMQDFSNPDYFTNREINWLDFNWRVFENAKLASLPVLERLKFLAIFYSNLDEFFRVRVARVLERYLCGDQPIPPDGMSPTELLQAIRREVLACYKSAETLWRKDICPTMASKGLAVLPIRRLLASQRKYLLSFFKSEVQPLIVIRDFDEENSANAVVDREVNLIASVLDAKGVKHFYWLAVPEDLPKVLYVPRSKKCEKSYGDLGRAFPGISEDLVLIDELVRFAAPSLFKGVKSIVLSTFRITRNTRLAFDEEADDVLWAVRDLLERRRYSEAMRLEIAHSMPRELSTVLVEKFRMRSFELYRVKGPQAFSRMISVYEADYPALKYVPYNAPTPKIFASKDLFEAIRKKDQFVYHPYENFSSVVSFIRRAAEDPTVKAIYQTIYRVGRNSPVVEALSEACRRGKAVTAVIELKARFDEERNITWAESLATLGVRVVYSPVDLKIHAKLCLVEREEQSALVGYLHVATGNYNPSTARLYSDMGLFTANAEICADAKALFSVMIDGKPHATYKRLLVSPVGTRNGVLDLIDREIESHRLYGDGEIDIKCNQLVDPETIRALYKASSVGVRVRLQVRGATSIKPGIAKVSENITLTSIVGRFLEHARIFRFHAHGNDLVYIGSADLMARNLDRRIEVLVPVLDKNVASTIRSVLELHLSDTVQCWALTPEGKYRRVVAGKGKKPVDSQQTMIERVRHGKFRDFE